MKNGKIVVARLWSRYSGGIPSRAPIIAGLNRNKYETICIYLKKSSNRPNCFSEKEGMKCFYISKKKFFRIFNIFAIINLVKIFKSEKVDILHCHRHQSTVYGLIAAKLAGVPIVFGQVHGLGRSTKKRKKINSLVLKKLTKILTVGQAVRDDVIKSNPEVKPEKVISVGNSIDYQRYADCELTRTQAREKLGLPEDSIVFGTVGRLAPTKGCKYLIEAFASVKQHVHNAHLLIIGDGRLADDLAQQAQQTGFADAIHFLGRRDDVPDCIRAMDVFVLSSIAEGLPRCLLEAMAADIPCIGTRAGGIPEVLEDGKLGLLADVKSFESLTDAMKELLNMPHEQILRMTHQAVQAVRNKYSHTSAIEKLESIYEQELAKINLKFN